MNSNQFKDNLIKISYYAELWEHSSKGEKNQRAISCQCSTEIATKNVNLPHNKNLK